MGIIGQEGSMYTDFQASSSRIKHMFDVQNAGEHDWLIKSNCSQGFII